MSDQIEKFLDEEWRHESWEYLNDVPHCACGEELRDDHYPGRALDEHRVRAALAAAGVAPQPEHFECDCVPNLGPSHCHACSDATGGEVEWSNCAAGVAPQPEPEYEYGPGYKEANGRWFSLDGAFTVRQAAEHSLNNYADDPQVHLLRRVKAGDWEPAPNQSIGDTK